ncbi:hypothetical protein H4219_004788, partial [Mycoemilia scoparia]
DRRNTLNINNTTSASNNNARNILDDSDDRSLRHYRRRHRHRLHRHGDGTDTSQQISLHIFDGTEDGDSRFQGTIDIPGLRVNAYGGHGPTTTTIDDGLGTRSSRGSRRRERISDSENNNNNNNNGVNNPTPVNMHSADRYGPSQAQNIRTNRDQNSEVRQDTDLRGIHRVPYGRRGPINSNNLPAAAAAAANTTTTTTGNSFGGIEGERIYNLPENIFYSNANINRYNDDNNNNNNNNNNTFGSGIRNRTLVNAPELGLGTVRGGHSQTEDIYNTGGFRSRRNSQNESLFSTDNASDNDVAETRERRGGGSDTTGNGNDENIFEASERDRPTRNIVESGNGNGNDDQFGIFAIGDFVPDDQIPNVIDRLIQMGFEARGADPASNHAMQNIPRRNIMAQEVYEYEVDDIVICLQCTHTLHESCGIRWLNESGVCPICRKVVEITTVQNNSNRGSTNRPPQRQYEPTRAQQPTTSQNNTSNNPPTRRNRDRRSSGSRGLIQGYPRIFEEPRDNLYN